MDCESWQRLVFCKKISAAVISWAVLKKHVIVNGIKKTWRNDEGFVIMDMKSFFFLR